MRKCAATVGISSKKHSKKEKKAETTKKEDKVTDQDSGIDLDDLVDELRDIFTEKVSTKDIKHILKTADNDIEKATKKKQVF